MWTYKCVVLVLIFCTVNSEATKPFVVTDFGTIKGLRADDGDYTMYLGVPFAQVNISNPFGAAIPHPGFEEIFEAYDDSTDCPEREEFNKTLVGSLDCLNLNIFVPNSANSEKRLPVLAYIYGGSFSAGSYNRYIYGPKFLVKHDIILITINYRGNIYGFMCLDTPEVPGNQGLKDQILALRWIKRHISAFGGDETKVTIGGHSAGSVSVDFHLQSNSEKLFDQAIVQSGTTFIPVFDEPIKTAPIIIADYLGFPTNSIDKAISFLAKYDTHLLITAAEKLGIIDNFKPCVEKEFEGIESFLTKNWLTANVPKIKSVPLLLGITNDERCAYHSSENDEYYRNLVERKLRYIYLDDTYYFKDMADILNNFYFGDVEVNAATRQLAIDFDSDVDFVYPFYKNIRRYLNNKAGNIFLLVFSYVGDRNYIRQIYNATKCKAVHGDDIGFLFDISYMKHWVVTDEDQQIIDRMTTIWTNFIKFGNPIPQPSDLLPVKWDPVMKLSKLSYVNINTKLKSESRLFHQRMAFWDLFHRATEHLQKAYPNTKVYLTSVVDKSSNPKTEL